jgi:hypothetical protein
MREVFVDEEGHRYSDGDDPDSRRYVHVGSTEVKGLRTKVSSTPSDVNAD